MTVLDAAELSAARAAAVARKSDAELTATAALEEFAAVAAQVGLPVWNWGERGAPAFLTEKGFDAGWVVLPDRSFEHQIHQIGSGVIVRRDGQTFLNSGPVEPSDAGRWLAKTLGFDREGILNHIRGLFVVV